MVKACSCFACGYDERIRMWIYQGDGELDKRIPGPAACPRCGDHLLPGGDKIPAAELRAAWNAMQAMREGKCSYLARVLGFGKGGETVTFCANGKAEEGRGATPEAAVAALLQKQGGDHAE